MNKTERLTRDEVDSVAYYWRPGQKGWFNGFEYEFVGIEDGVLVFVDRKKDLRLTVRHRYVPNGPCDMMHIYCFMNGESIYHSVSANSMKPYPY